MLPVSCRRLVAACATAALAVVALAAPADAATTAGTSWGQFGFDATHSGNNAAETTITKANVGSLRQAWGYNAQDTLSDPPVLVNGIAYTGGNSEVLLAINAANGSGLWGYPTTSEINGPPAVANGILYFHTSEGLYALNAKTGALVWTDKPPSGTSFTMGSPSVANGLLYLSVASTVTAYDAASGAVVWSIPVQSLGTPNSVTVAGNTAYYAGYRGGIYAVNAKTGAPIWHTDPGEPFLANPSVISGVLYIGGAMSTTYAFNASTGAQLWSYATAASTPAVANGTVYVCDLGGVLALNAKTGAFIWANNDPNEGCSQSGSVSVANGIVYNALGDREYAYDAGNGSLLAETVHLTTGTGYECSQPIIADGSALFTCTDGNLHRYTLNGVQRA